MDAVAEEVKLAQARDVMGKENNSTSYEPAKSAMRVRALLFFVLAGTDFLAFRSVKNVMRIPCPSLTGSRGFRA